MKKTKKTLASLVIAGMLATMVPFNALASVPEMGNRLAGYTAYDTAQVIAEQTESADSVVLAAGMTRNSVDALAAGPLAFQLKAPILLTDGDGTLTDQAKAELRRLMPKKVYVTSGTAVILPAAKAEVEAITGVGTVVALGGFDAPETSLNIAKQMVDLGAHPTGIVVAGGWASPADALSAASIASAKGYPILAVAKTGLSADQKAFVASLTGIVNSYVVGGTAVIDTAVEATLPGIVTRLAGMTQYDTNLKVLRNFTDLNYDKVFIANGKTFVDALAGAPLVAQYNSAIVLADQVVDSALVTYVKGKITPTSKVIALGGTAAVPESALDQVANAVPETVDPTIEARTVEFVSNIVFKINGTAYALVPTTEMDTITDDVKVIAFGGAAVNIAVNAGDLVNVVTNGGTLVSVTKDVNENDQVALTNAITTAQKLIVAERTKATTVSVGDAAALALGGIIVADYVDETAVGSIYDLAIQAAVASNVPTATDADLVAATGTLHVASDAFALLKTPYDNAVTVLARNRAAATVLVTAATTSVTTAETAKTDATVLVAQTLVTALPLGADGAVTAVTAALQGRINAIVTAEDALAALVPLNTALNAGTATVAQYTAAGITGVSISNLAAVNTAVEAVKTALIDLTQLEIQTVVSSL